MRKFVIYIGLLVCAITVQAQDPETGLYRSFFGEDSTVWNVSEMYFDDVNFNETYVFAGDTLIDDTLICKNVYYKSQWSRRIEDGTWYDYDTLIWYGNIREDRTTGRLWYKSRLPDWELLADMTLSMEDSFDGYRVKDIIIDSLGRKVILFNGRNPFIEGVGPIDFDVYGNRTVLGYTLVCVKHDDDSQFSMDLSSGIFTRWLSKYYAVINCRLHRTVGISETKLSLVRIWPNPCMNTLNIDIPQPINIKIIDSKGCVVINARSKGDNIQLDLSKLVKGLYIMNLETTGHKENIIRKIVKL